MTGPSIRPHEKFPGVYWLEVLREERRLATLSQAPGINVYGEMYYKIRGDEYRVWDPYRSKLAAAILKGISDIVLRPGSKMVYLGAASGTTVSHVSDIVGPRGHVYCVEFAQRSFRDLVNNVCRNRQNTSPILEDARFPVRYRSIVPEVDCVYSDIAQPDQARILAENLDLFLRQKGGFLLAVKSRSVDVTMKPSEVFRQEARELEKRGYKVRETVRLDPFEIDHCMMIGTG